MMKKIVYNSPVVLSFVILSFCALLLNQVTNGLANRLLFSAYRFNPLDIFGYFRMFGYTLGHVSWSHFSGNMMIILLTGPLLEEKYGSKILLRIMIITALATSFLHVLFSNQAILGASGIAFCFIMLSSVVSDGDGIPLTLIIIAIIYLGSQIISGLTVTNNVSEFGHLVGGLIGIVSGFKYNPKRSIK